jgi:secondary thiamine-phosphate synthase enzyme
MVSLVHIVDVNTSSRTELLDITSRISHIVRDSAVSEGICVIFVPHTTGAVTINENADPDVKKDILKEVNKLIPFEDDYRHGEGNSAAHIKSSIIGCYQMIPVSGGSLQLGTWQGILFCEFDGPRHRKVYVQLLE